MRKLRRLILPVSALILSILACQTEVTPVASVESIRLETGSSESTPQLTSTSTPTPSTTPTLTPTVNLTPMPVGAATIIVENCNLRAGPGTDYAVVGYGKQGDIYLVYGQNDDGTWFQIDMDGKLWIKASLVKFEPVSLVTPVG